MSKRIKKAEPCGEGDKVVSMAAIAKLLEEHRAALSADFKTTVSKLEVKLDQIQVTVMEHASKIASLETHTNSQDECTNALKTTCAKLAESNAKLLAKFVDLESCSRHNKNRWVTRIH